MACRTLRSRRAIPTAPHTLRAQGHRACKTRRSSCPHMGRSREKDRSGALRASSFRCCNRPWGKSPRRRGTSRTAVGRNPAVRCMRSRESLRIRRRGRSGPRRRREQRTCRRTFCRRTGRRLPSRECGRGAAPRSRCRRPRRTRPQTRPTRPTRPTTAACSSATRRHRQSRPKSPQRNRRLQRAWYGAGWRIGAD